MLTFTILQQASEYTFIWSPPGVGEGAATLRAPMAAACCLTTTLPPHQQLELQSAIDSAAQVINQLRAPRLPAPSLAAPQDGTGGNGTGARMGTGMGAGGEDEQPLLRLGRLLFSYLLPQPLQETIRRLPAPSPMLICTNDTELPWELLHDDQGFLALRHSVSRQLLMSTSSEQSVPPRPYQPLRALLVGNPTGDLPAADGEIENLLELFHLSSPPIRVEFLCREHASQMRVMTALASGDYDLIHFACHARPGAMRLADGWLEAGEIQGVLRGHPLVFLNACSSGRSEVAKPAALSLSQPLSQPVSRVLSGEATHNLAQAFLAGGAMAFVGTAWPVADGEMGGLALEFYRQLCNGATLAAAMRLARLRTQSRAQQATSWSAPLLYGDPHQRLPSEVVQTQPGTVMVVRLHPGPVGANGHGHAHPVSISPAHTPSLPPLTSELVAILRRHGAELTVVRAEYLHALFGLPDPVEDDALRALRAALEVRALVQQRGEERRAGEWDAPEKRAPNQSGPETLGPENLAMGMQVSIAVASGTLARSNLHAHFGFGYGGQGYGSQGQSGVGDAPLYIGTPFAEADALLAQCQPAQILINPRGHQLAKAHFAFMPRLDARVGEGQSEDAISFEVTALPSSAPLTSPTENAAPPGHLMGRQRELEFLMAAWQEAQRGRGQVIGIAGEAGVGKTRLLQEMARRVASGAQAAGALTSRPQWIKLVCSSTGRDTPFRLVAQLLQKIFQIDPSDSNAQVETKIANRLGKFALGSAAGGQGAGGHAGHDAQINQILRETLGFASSASLAGLPSDERKARRGRLVHLLRTLMAQEAQRQPLIIAIDDIHWMDEASLEVLAQLTEGIHRLPMQFVLLYRPDWRHNWFDKAYYRQLHLEPLDHQASLELLCMLLQSEQLPPGLAALLQKTGGNPFFIEEMVKSLQETGILVPRPSATAISGAAAGASSGAGQQWELLRPLTEHYLPGTVDRALRVRLQSLTPATREVLEAAAVIGPIFTLALVQKMLEPMADNVEGALAELEQRGFVEFHWGTQEYRFCHALILESVYHSLPHGQPQTLHRRIAEILESGALPLTSHEALAHHYYHSLLLSRLGESPKLDEQAPVHLVRKGVNALIECGRRALERTAAREATTYFQRALLLNRVLPDGYHDELVCREGIGDALNMLGNFDAAYHELRQAYGVLHTQPLDKAARRLAADLARRIGRLCAWRGEHDVAMQWMHEGLRQLGELEDADDQAVAALLHVHTGSVEYNRGNLDQVVTECERGLLLAEGTGRHLPAEAEANNMLGILSWARGRNQEALAYYSQSHAAWLRLGNSYQAARVAGNMGVVYYYLSQWEQARLQHTRCQEYWEQIEDLDMLAHPCLNLGNIYLCQGNWEQAEINFGRAVELWSKAHHKRFTSLGHTNLGLLYIEQGQWAKARAQLVESQSILNQAGIRDLLPEVLYSLAEVELGEGALAQAQELATQAREMAMGLEMRPEEALALRVLGRIALAQGEIEGARQWLQQAREYLQGLDNRYEVGRTLYYLAQTEVAAGALALARDYFTQALTSFTELGARHDEQRAEAQLANLTERVAM